MTLLLRLWPYLAGVALLVGGYLFVDHRGYQRGYAAKNAEVIKAAERYRKEADRLNAALSQTAAERDAALQARTDAISGQGRDLQTIVIREQANDPRYRSVECSTAGGVSDAIRAAGLLSHRAPTDDPGSDALPGSPAPQR